MNWKSLPAAMAAARCIPIHSGASTSRPIRSRFRLRGKSHYDSAPLSKLKPSEF